MNILRNMEAIFISSAAVACLGAASTGGAPSPAIAAPMFDAGTPMQVVVVSAKRMTADEKLQSMRAERQLASVRHAAARRG